MHSKMISLGLLALASCSFAAPHGSGIGKRSFFSWFNPDGVSECLAALPSDGKPAGNRRGRYCNRRSSSAVAVAAVAAATAAADTQVAPAAVDVPADGQDTVQIVTDITYVTDVETVYVTSTAAAATSANENVAVASSPVVIVASTPAALPTPAVVSSIAAVISSAPAAPVVPSPIGDVVSTVFAASVAAPSAVVVPAPVNNVVKPATYNAGAAKSSTAAAPAAASSQVVAPVAAASAGKRGIPYNVASLTTPFAGKKVTWAYNWGSSSSGLGKDFEFVPMLWGGGSHATNFAADAAKAIAAGSKHLLAFNEPDHTEQANMSPAAAAAAYKTLFDAPFAGKARLGAPAVTNGGGSMGLTWLGNFMSACSGCTIDFVPIHWYDSATNIQYFKDHVTKAHTMTGKPVWITEFGASGSDDQINTFLKTVIPWMESQDFIERYSYFMASEGLLCKSGGLSSYGQTYATL